MKRRSKLRPLFWLIGTVAGLASCGLADALLTTSPAWLLVILIALTAIQVLVVVWGIYSSRFWAHWPPRGGAILSWGMVVVMLLFVMAIDFVVVPMGILEIWLQHTGELAEGTIVDRQVMSRDGSDPSHQYHRITYQWTVAGSGSTARQYTGEVNAPLSWSSHTAPGTRITVRYLPSHPQVSRVEEDFALSAVNQVGVASFVDMYMILSGTALILRHRPEPGG